MALLQSFINDTQNRPSLAVFQSTVAQTAVPLLRQYLANSQVGKAKPRHRVLFSLLTQGVDVEVHDWLDNVPGYSTDYFNPGLQLLSTLDQTLNTTSSSVDVVIDSIDSLLSDAGSLSEAYKYLRDAHAKIAARPGSTLVLHGTRVDLVSLVTQASFTPSLVHIKAHPTVILDHLAVEYLTPPPPISPSPKFWGVFLPLSQRQKDVNDLVFGSKGEGSGDATEIVVEILVRGVSGRKRNVERELEAWSLSLGPCEWSDLEALRSIWSKQTPAETLLKMCPSILSLTTAQHEARSKVPLPYPVDTTGTIFYDPDSADDIDDDDPDEDLDI
ncbi:hypothetical protein DFP72DRAFT_1028776 [Ephemerocybe angulata]|uniref:Elongator complex protein 5 n=1 Tax=Ephemerocybe angulata TaxID=980116 RepID=A0A8H6IKY0_9AGAR|nr:hypothetical protein DFP72DRAFT_1028776 [Tulosesus angulatus]